MKHHFHLMVGWYYEIGESKSTVRLPFTIEREDDGLDESNIAEDFGCALADRLGLEYEGVEWVGEDVGAENSRV
jgi:hypothetical protein